MNANHPSLRHSYLPAPYHVGPLHAGPFQVHRYAPQLRRSILALVGIAAITLVVLGLGGCGSRTATGQTAPPAPAVDVAKVVTRDVSLWDGFTGRVAAVETVELRPRVTGYVERVAYEEGQEVAKGDLLFVIDQRSYQAELDRAEAELERARSEARLARTQVERAQTLAAAKAISREELDTRVAATAQTAAAVQAAEAAVATAKLNLKFTEVRSPIDGQAGRALVTVGNLAQADATLLTTVVSLDPVHVYFSIDEQSSLRYGALARDGERDRTDTPVRVGLADETGFQHEGVVDFIDNHVDPDTGTVSARAVLPNADRVFKPGLFARVELRGGEEFPALLIDDKAVLTDQDRTYVYVVGADNKAQRKDVELGRATDGLRVVRSGLGAQDRVIVNGVQKVFFPGMPVDPTLVAMDGAPAPVVPDREVASSKGAN
jgi:multidrug efflux system membrane fusion protein